MKNPFKKSVEKFPILRLFGNRYFMVTAFFAVWLLFLDNASYIEHRRLNKEIKELETNKQYYLDEIAKDQKQIKELNNIDKIEHYAREKYYMRRANEDVYVIEYDTIKP